MDLPVLPGELICRIPRRSEILDEVGRFLFCKFQVAFFFAFDCAWKQGRGWAGAGDPGAHLPGSEASRCSIQWVTRVATATERMACETLLLLEHGLARIWLDGRNRGLSRDVYLRMGFIAEMGTIPAQSSDAGEQNKDGRGCETEGDGKELAHQAISKCSK